MRRILVAALIVWGAATATGSASATGYLCDVTGYYSYAGGRIGPADLDWLSVAAQLSFDDETGILLRGSLEPMTLTVLQRGSRQNGVVALRIFKGPAAVAATYLQISTYREPKSFALLDDHDIGVGTCVASRFPQ